jgi:hypothetical protein
LSVVGSLGYYWSSTYINMETLYTLTFRSSLVYAGNDNNHRMHGFSVRCVAEWKIL